MVAARLIDVTTKGRLYVDRYELVGEVASGGMATVFLARATGMGGFQRLFALKRLHPHLGSDPEFVEMFLDEARLAARIHHPNVVSILEVGANEAGYYLLMEYVEGDTLARLVARAAAHKHRVPGPILLRILLDTLAGLHAAHELRDDEGNLYGVVHRDVSPQNILVGRDGIARITDFGVARASARLSGSRAGQLKGKLAYMSPEQASGENVDRRADVFSAGVVLWECLASKRLFKASHDAATLSRVISGPIPDISEMCPGIHPHLARVVMRALERPPEQRYSSSAEFADAIERAAVGNVASSRDLAAYVDEVIGTEIRLQERTVREWLAQHEPEALPLSRTPASLRLQTASTSQAIPPMATPAPMDPRALEGRRSKWPAVGIGVAASALLLGGYLALRAPDDIPPAPASAPLPGEFAQMAGGPERLEPSPPPPAASSADALPGEVQSPPPASVEPAAPAKRPAPAAPGAGRRPSRPVKKPKPSVDLSNPYR